MATTDPACPRCDKRMERGYIPDGVQNGSKISCWMPGAPQRSFWLSLWVPKSQVVPIGTFRCPSCGLLESYARPEFALKPPGAND